MQESRAYIKPRGVVHDMMSIFANAHEMHNMQALHKHKICHLRYNRIILLSTEGSIEKALTANSIRKCPNCTFIRHNVQAGEVEQKD